MDTQTAKEAVDPAARQIALIEARMPMTHAAIKAKAAEIGNAAYGLVRRGARGEPGCFYACERDNKVGTPWAAAVPLDVVQLVERYGMSFACMWPDQVKGDDGAY